MTNSSHCEIQAREKAELETEGVRPGLTFRPDVDILERPDAFVVLADMPGVSEESVDIHLEKGVLTLDARPAEVASDEGVPTDTEEVNHESNSSTYAEYRTGGYHREFRLSKDIDTAAVTATMKHGVLELVLPKSAESQPRRISVAAA